MNYNFFKKLTLEEKNHIISMLKENKEQLERHIIPGQYPDMPLETVVITTLEYPELSRDNIIELSAFCLISKDWIKELYPLLKGKRCLEIMSGSGMLTYAFKDIGIDIIATDSKEWEYSMDQYWCEVEKIDCIAAIEKYGADVDFVICSWIPHQSNAGTNALLKMRENNPDAQMIYIGEMGGCCADRSFVEVCNMIENPYVKNANRLFKSWYGFRDQIFLLN